MFARTMCSALLLTMCLAGRERVAVGQYYPAGYAHTGWGGWNAAAGRGAEAYGMGNMAAGRGSYNLQTSEARATNVNTNMQLNEYMYQSIQQRDKALYAAQAKEAKDYTEALNQTQDRLRNNPTQEDIYKGDALNIALTELTDPRYYAHVEQFAAQMKIPGNLIKVLPFNDAANAVTFGIKQITSATPGPVMQKPEFADLVAEYKKLGEELNQQAETTGDVKSETVQAFRAVIQRGCDRLRAATDVPQAEKNQVQMHLKALLGLSYMLDGPSLDVFLAELKGGEQIGLDRLFAFMRAFNLRFGQATNPNQREAFDTLYPMLVQLRNEMFGNGTGTLPSDAPPPRADDQRPLKFFAGMDPNDLHPERPRTPPTTPQPPAPGPG